MTTQPQKRSPRQSVCMIDPLEGRALMSVGASVDYPPTPIQPTQGEISLTAQVEPVAAKEQFTRTKPHVNVG